MCRADSKGKNERRVGCLWKCLAFVEGRDMTAEIPIGQQVVCSFLTDRKISVVL